MPVFRQLTFVLGVCLFCLFQSSEIHRIGKPKRTYFVFSFLNEMISLMCIFVCAYVFEAGLNSFCYPSLPAAQSRCFVDIAQIRSNPSQQFPMAAAPTPIISHRCLQWNCHIHHSYTCIIPSDFGLHSCSAKMGPWFDQSMLIFL